mmetsp:Transcript_60039/g.54039  ORF Transcript_60039/g.54039 Transcript_60039/m.54039 type:complete len:300 (-) Transcript_60039:132-1031(-)
MAQPGDDQKGNEGNDTQFGDYRCVFRPTDDALFIMMKNSKTKRTFENTFSKSTLLEMDLKQPIDKVVNLLLDAKSGKTEELSFKIGFGDAEGETKGSMNKSQQCQPEVSQQVSFDKLSKSYLKGSALYIFVNMDNNYFSAEYVFKLLEQERDDMDILRDIIADMQEEIDVLKRDKKRGIASWYTTHTGGGNIPMSAVRLASTLEGMVTLSQDTRTITVNIPGTYRLSLEVNFTSCTGAGHLIQIQLNGTQVGSKYGSNNGGFGYLSRILNLKKDDKIVFYTNHIYATNQYYSCFTVEKI